MTRLRPAASLAFAALVAAAVGAGTWLALASRGGLVVAAAERGKDPGRPARLDRGATPHEGAAARFEATSGSPAPVAELAERDDLERALAELAARLAAPTLDAFRWEACVGATARSLGPRAEDLAAVAADPARPEGERVAALELLAALGGPHAAVEGSALELLRGLAHAADLRPARRAAGVHALAALGTEADRFDLVERLARAPGIDERRVLGWSLGAAHGAWVAFALGDLVAYAGTAVEPALLALQSMASADGAIPEDARAVVAESVARALTSQGASELARRRACGALGALGSAPARFELEQLLRAHAEDDLAEAAALALATSPDPEARGTLRGVVDDPGAPSGRRLLAAESLARASADPAALRLLAEAARADEDPVRRRRAVFALAAAPPDPGLRPLLDAAARTDPEARVRAAAALALERHEPAR